MPNSRDVAELSVRPIIAVAGVVLRDDRVLLVRRAHAPDAGRWCFPGGKIERGESIECSVVRELNEETGIDVRAGRLLDVATVLDYSSGNEIFQHYIVLLLLCQWLRGEPVAGDDALDAAWFDIPGLSAVDLVSCIDIVNMTERAIASEYRSGGAQVGCCSEWDPRRRWG